MHEASEENAASASNGPTFEPEAMERLVLEQGCAGCHTFHGERLVGPPLDRMQGEPRKFRDGSIGVVDAAYVVESILDPSAKVVDGYADVMPSYAERLDEAEAASLAAYLVSLR